MKGNEELIQRNKEFEKQLTILKDENSKLSDSLIKQKLLNNELAKIQVQ